MSPFPNVDNEERENYGFSGLEHGGQVVKEICAASASFLAYLNFQLIKINHFI
jgi:hypothetical protein